MFRCFNLLLLLFCQVYHSETSSISVSGKKRGNIRLRCEHEDDNIVYIELFSESGIISVCETEECRGRVFKEGNCDVVIKNLIFSDAGKYSLRIIYNNDQTELKPKKEWKFDLHIHDEISVKTGEELKMSVLVSNADKVKTNSSGEWKEVWTRDHGVQSDRMNDDNDGNLTIKSFLDSDAGTYRVLDTEGEILITVTASGTESPETHKNDTGQHKNWIVSVVVCLVILVVAVIVISVIIWRRQHRDHTQVQENTENTQELEKL
ncbi:uncharacterized protein LOC113062514 isoform X2 [Carassius auratus]|uniref:Uncharacterized protein LOC113062514 isoform X1 n=1 Tax=Carassius auratus TaxID=7957 RepID=A0A6P6LXI8_CARAU|nr:uncharacterized protein LOC113062514 isoform X1 [Carassius auratus]XP_026088206.1 uncharacterized protein LOC113062514 isoform X2 [Carassius auratus]